IDGLDQASLGVVVIAQACPAQWIDDLVQVMGRRGTIVKLGHVASAICDGDQVALAIVLVADTISHRIDDGSDAALRIAFERDTDTGRTGNAIVAESQGIVVWIADGGKLTCDPVNGVGRAVGRSKEIGAAKKRVSWVVRYSRLEVE